MTDKSSIIRSKLRVSTQHEDHQVTGHVKKQKEHRKAHEQWLATLQDLHERLGRLEDRDTQQQAFISLIELLPRLDPSLVNEMFARIEKNKNPERTSTRRMLVLLLAAMCKCHPLGTARLLPRVLIYLTLRLRDKQVQITDACVILCSAIALYVVPNTRVHPQHGGISPRKKAVSSTEASENDCTPVLEHVTSTLFKVASAHSIGGHANQCVCGLLYPVEFDGVTRPSVEVLRTHGLRIHGFATTLITQLVMKLNESTIYSTFNSTFLLLHTAIELARDLHRADQPALYNVVLPHVQHIIEAIEDVFREASREDWMLRERGIKLLGLLVDVFAVGETAKDADTVAELFQSHNVPIRRIVTDARHDPVSTVREATLAISNIFNKFDKLFRCTGEVQAPVSPFKRVFHPKSTPVIRPDSPHLYHKENSPVRANREKLSTPPPRIKLRDQVRGTESKRQQPWWTDMPLEDDDAKQSDYSQDKAKSKPSVPSGDKDVKPDEKKDGRNNVVPETANVTSQEVRGDTKDSSNQSSAIDAKPLEEDEDIIDLGGDESANPLDHAVEEHDREVEIVPKKPIKAATEPKIEKPIRKASSKKLVVDKPTVVELIQPIVRQPSRLQDIPLNAAVYTRNKSSNNISSDNKQEDIRRLSSDANTLKTSPSTVPVNAANEDDDILPDFDDNNPEEVLDEMDGDEAAPPFDNESSTVASKPLLAKKPSTRIGQEAKEVNKTLIDTTPTQVMTRADAARVAAENGETELALRLCFIEDNQTLLINVLGQIGTSINMQGLSRATRNALCASFLQLLDEGQDSSTMWIVIPWLRDLVRSSRLVQELDIRVIQALEERLYHLSMEPTKIGLVAADLLVKIER